MFNVILIHLGAEYVEQYEIHDRDFTVEEKPLTKAQKKNLRKKQKRKEQKASQVAFVIEEVTSAIEQVTIESSDQTSDAAAPVDTSVHVSIPQESTKHEEEHDRDVLKKVRTLRKKLKQIEELEARIASGEIHKPDSDQLNKIAKKEAFLEELELLEGGR